MQTTSWAFWPLAALASAAALSAPVLAQRGARPQATDYVYEVHGSYNAECFRLHLRETDRDPQRDKPRRVTFRCSGNLGPGGEIPPGGPNNDPLPIRLTLTPKQAACLLPLANGRDPLRIKLSQCGVRPPVGM